MLRPYCFSIALALGLATGCGKTVSLGPYDPGADAGTIALDGGVMSCTGLACGTPCPLPDQPDFGSCDGAGVCSSTYACSTYAPCKACGEPCNPCDPLDSAPCPLPPDFKSFTCDEKGACVPGGIACPPCKAGDPYCPYDPCADQPCGTPCDRCPPDDPTCPPNGPSFCSLGGKCAPMGEASCDPCTDPKTGVPLLCGQPCDLCSAQPWDSSCVQSMIISVCGASGTCGPPEVAKCSPDYQPCVGKKCGDLCTVCDTKSDPNCYPGQFLFCGGDGPAASCGQFTNCPAIGCAGQACGTQCLSCAGNQSCAPMFCDAYGACTYADSVQCGTYLPCASGTCGEPCMLCDMSSCVEGAFLVCGSDGGTCTDLPSCYSPCAGKSVCSTCTLCDPADLGCMEPDPQRKFCDSFGQCTAAQECM